MRLSALLDNSETFLTIDPEIAYLTLDSRELKKDAAFFAIAGSKNDGRQFIQDAIAKQAAAIFVEAAQCDFEIQNHIPIISIPNLPQKIATYAARFYDFPAEKLRLFGVTGTSGKTTCTHFLAQTFQAASIPCGLIGTLGSGMYGQLSDVNLTTPDAITLQAKLQHFLHQGAKAVAMEVSSHGIHQGRINTIAFEVAAFTNLSQDHLDYHGDMQTYAGVKQSFLKSPQTKKIILNIDDPYGQNWLNDLAQEKQLQTYSTKNTKAAIYAYDIKLQPSGIIAQLITPWGKGELHLPLIGLFNLSNALAVLGMLCTSTMSLKDALHYLAKVDTVPGRMQMIHKQNKPLVVVDYAHKPDALEKVLQVLRAHTQGKVICVFGCGGERDRAKRPLMAKIAEHYADKVIVTNDNPRHENPADIAAEIMQGFLHSNEVIVDLDRSHAIHKSIQWASPSDCVLIAGKGAEHYQQIGDDKIPFDDVSHVKRFLNLNE